MPARLPSAAGLGPGRPLAGQRVGVFWRWFEDADAEVVAACRHALRLLEEHDCEARGCIHARDMRAKESEADSCVRPTTFMNAVIFCACARVGALDEDDSAHSRLPTLKP